jgi:cytidine deaminase
MEDRKILVTYKAFQPGEISATDQVLITSAIEACQYAYAPYSNFKVGAAVRTDDQLIVIGSNQENSAYPIGQCAERVALYALAHQHGRKVIDTIAVAVDNDQQHAPASPCGSCRQLLSEYRSYQTQPIRLLLTLAKGGEVFEIKDVNDLLPLAFDGKFLGVE